MRIIYSRVVQFYRNSPGGSQYVAHVVVRLGNMWRFVRLDEKQRTALGPTFRCVPGWQRWEFLEDQFVKSGAWVRVDMRPVQAGVDNWQIVEINDDKTS